MDTGPIHKSKGKKQKANWRSPLWAQRKTKALQGPFSSASLLVSMLDLSEILISPYGSCSVSCSVNHWDLPRCNMDSSPTKIKQEFGIHCTIGKWAVPVKWLSCMFVDLGNTRYIAKAAVNWSLFNLKVLQQKTEVYVGSFLLGAAYQPCCISDLDLSQSVYIILV